MPISLASYIQPRNATNPDPALRGTYYLMEDVYLKGGFQIRTDEADRDSILDLNRKVGMLVMTQSDGKVWKLGTDLVTWTEFQMGGGGAGGAGVRQVVVQNIPALDSNDFLEFSLALGKTAIIQKLEVDTPCTVEAYWTPERLDPNPYKFIATTGMLVDDGTTLLSDGTTMKGRSFSIFSNLEETPSNKIYFRVVNNEAVAKNITLTITYLTME